MKKLVIWLTGIMFISFGIAWALMPGGAGIQILSASKYESNIDQEKTEKLDGIDTISISTSSENINIIPENREDIRVHFNGGFTSSNKDYDPKLVVEKTGNEIRIGIERPKISISFSRTNLKLDVYVPEDYSKRLDVSSSSGNTSISGLKLERFDFESSSGDLKVNSLQAGQADMKSSSGSIIVDGFLGNLEADSSSGKINIDFQNLEGNVDIGTSSGDIKLNLIKDSNFELNASTSSGDIDCEISLSNMSKGKHDLTGTAGTGKNNIMLRTSSGDIDVLDK